jgi:hypothetical protein
MASFLQHHLLGDQADLSVDSDPQGRERKVQSSLHHSDIYDQPTYGLENFLSSERRNNRFAVNDKSMAFVSAESSIESGDFTMSSKKVDDGFDIDYQDSKGRQHPSQLFKFGSSIKLSSKARLHQMQNQQYSSLEMSSSAALAPD